MLPHASHRSQSLCAFDKWAQLASKQIAMPPCYTCALKTDTISCHTVDIHLVLQTWHTRPCQAAGYDISCHSQESSEVFHDSFVYACSLQQHRHSYHYHPTQVHSLSPLITPCLEMSSSPSHPHCSFQYLRLVCLPVSSTSFKRGLEIKLQATQITGRVPSTYHSHFMS